MESIRHSCPMCVSPSSYFISFYLCRLYERNEKSIVVVINSRGEINMRRKNAMEKIYSEVWRKFRALDGVVQWGLVCANLLECEQYECDCSYDKSIHLFFAAMTFLLIPYSVLCNEVFVNVRSIPRYRQWCDQTRDD